MSPRDRARVKEEVGEFVLTESLRLISQGKSPVKGESFKKLDREYADKFKGGNRTPNLELEGDMLDAFKVENRAGNEIEIGIFSKREAPKADGHNNFSGDSSLPRRRFVPTEDQEYKREIQAGIKRIIKSNEQETVSVRTDFIRRAPESAVVEDLFGPSALDLIIRDLFSDGQS